VGSRFVVRTTNRERRTIEPPVLSHAEYRSIVEQAPIMIWRSNVHSKCDYFNQRWLAFTGRTLEDELGDGWAKGVHPEDAERCLKIYASTSPTAWKRASRLRAPR
jgi:PAS domain S-box-containing protein